MLMDLLENKKKPFIIVLTKCDKLSNIDNIF
jgi:GTP-binding protein EngB required for normal cell division